MKIYLIILLALTATTSFADRGSSIDVSGYSYSTSSTDFEITPAKATTATKSNTKYNRLYSAEPNVTFRYYTPTLGVHLNALGGKNYASGDTIVGYRFGNQFELGVYMYFANETTTTESGSTTITTLENKTSMFGVGPSFRFTFGTDNAVQFELPGVLGLGGITIQTETANGANTDQTLISGSAFFVNLSPAVAIKLSDKLSWLISVNGSYYTGSPDYTVTTAGVATKGTADFSSLNIKFIPIAMRWYL